MLNILHDKINEICPISCLYDGGNGNFRIDYIAQPNQQQLSQINNLLVSWPLDKAKMQKIQELDEYWKTVLDQGWTSPYGWKLGLNNQDVTLLTGAFILLKEAASMGLSNTTTIIDTDSVPHELNLTDMTSLMLAYGQHRSQLSQQYSTKKQTIESAASLSELNNFSVYD